MLPRCDILIAVHYNLKPIEEVRGISNGNRQYLQEVGLVCCEAADNTSTYEYDTVHMLFETGNNHLRTGANAVVSPVW